MSADARQDQIISAAVALFAEVGLDGSTREVANRAGITQPLLYRYFPNKDSLIEAVYARVYLDRWNPEWDAALEDRTRPVRARFYQFYMDYTDTIFDPVWLRLSTFAALRDARLHRWYSHVIEELILKRLVRERSIEEGGAARFGFEREELEPVWLMHDAIVQYGMRRHILGFDVVEDKGKVISMALDQYLCAQATR